MAEAASSAQALEALADDLKRSKENHERSQQQLNEEKNKVHELLQQVDGLEEKCSEEHLRATTLDQQLYLGHGFIMFHTCVFFVAICIYLLVVFVR